MVSPTGVARGIYQSGAGLFRWMFPLARMNESELETTVNDVLNKYPDIRATVNKNPAYRDELKYAVRDAYTENLRLRKLSGYVDTIDKFLVPFDIVADYMKIMGGVGYGLSTAKEIIEGVFKLPYIAYYAIKTGDLTGSIGSLIYEGLSWFITGSILDLTNRYAKQADKYIAQTAAKKFTQGLEADLFAREKSKSKSRLDFAPQPA